MNTPLVPAGLIGSILADFNPRRAILFGSIARGDSEPDGGIDLLGVVDDDTPPDKVTLRAGLDSCRAYRQPTDVIRVHWFPFQRKSKIADTLARSVMQEGIADYGHR